MFCHFVYLQNFTPTWPFISLSSLSFLGSCVLVVVDHFLWFFYFARITQEARHRAHRSYRGPPLPHAVPNFGDIATFFGICVWLAPLFLFLSLSANDNALPTNAGEQKSISNPTYAFLTQAQEQAVCLRLRRKRSQRGHVLPCSSRSSMSFRWMQSPASGRAIGGEIRQKASSHLVRRQPNLRRRALVQCLA